MKIYKALGTKLVLSCPLLVYTVDLVTYDYFVRPSTDLSAREFLSIISNDTTKTVIRFFSLRGGKIFLGYIR